MSDILVRSWDRKESARSVRLTNLVEHLVALIEHESLDVAQTELLVANQCVETSWGSDDDVWVGVFAGQEFDILLHWGTSVEDCSLDVGHVLAEAGVFVLDLVRQFTGMTHDEHGGFAIDGLNLLESRKNEDSRLSQSGFGLAENV